MITYTIPTENVPKMVNRFKTLRRRAKKLNFPAPIWTLSDERTVRSTEIQEDGSEHVVWRSLVNVSVEGEGPVLEGGWKLVAVIEPASEERNLVLVVPGVERFEVSEYLTIPMSRCDHCGMSRNRSAIFVVQDESGTRSVVGRQCLKDFTGHSSPESIVAWATMWVEVNQMSDHEEREAGSGGSDYLDLPDYLSAVAACIRVDGWMSKAAAEAQCTASTSADASFLDTGVARSYDEREWKADRCPTSADRETAKTSITWASELSGRLSDFEENVKTIASAGYVKIRRTGLAAAIVFSYLRNIESLKKREKAISESQYIGTVKERSTWTATFTGMSSFEGNYGWTYLCRFLVEGSEVVWWASRNPELVSGDEVELTGTVKGHALYRGVCQTTLTRCKITRSNA